MFSHLPKQQLQKDIEEERQLLIKQFAKESDGVSAGTKSDAHGNIFTFITDDPLNKEAFNQEQKGRGYKVICTSALKTQTDKLPAGFYLFVKTKNQHFIALKLGEGQRTTHTFVLNKLNLIPNSKRANYSQFSKKFDVGIASKGNKLTEANNIEGGGELYVGPDGTIIMGNPKSATYKGNMLKNYEFNPKKNLAQQYKTFMGLSSAMFFCDFDFYKDAISRSLLEQTFLSSGDWKMKLNADEKFNADDVLKKLNQFPELLAIDENKLKKLDPCSLKFVSLFADAYIKYRNQKLAAPQPALDTKASLFQKAPDTSKSSANPPSDQFTSVVPSPGQASNKKS